MHTRRPGRLVLASLCAAALLLSTRQASGAAPVSFQEIEESLTCQCGCGLTVHSCNHLQCPSAVPLREEIRAQMQQGKGRDAILAYFSDKYGEKILSAPGTSGFNLLAWITPFVLVALGGGVVGLTVMRWRRRRRSAPSPATGARPAAASAYEKILAKELEHFDS